MSCACGIGSGFAGLGDLQEDSTAGFIVVADIYDWELQGEGQRLHAAIERSLATQGMAIPRLAERRPQRTVDVAAGGFKELIICTGRDAATNRERLHAYADRRIAPGRSVEISFYVDAARYPAQRIKEILESPRSPA